MQKEWSNWSGSIRFSPAKVEIPANEEKLAELIRRATKENRCVRVAGAGHSSSALVETNDILVSLEKLTGVEDYDTSANTATLLAGTTLENTGKSLLDVGLAMINLGDVSTQTIAGAFSTGTHGSGKNLQNLPASLVGGRIVTGNGEIIEFSEDADFLRAAKVSLGILGIFTALKFRVLPAYELHRQEWCMHTETCLAHLEQLIEENRNFDFYWYPRSDEAKIRILNPPGQGTTYISDARKVEDKTGWGHKLIPKHTHISLKFEEMEYALPAEAGVACFQEVRNRIKEKHRKIVGWRVLYRIVAPDDGYLSPAYGRQTVTISLHQNAGLPFEEFFSDIEPIFRAYEGRPHWGKKHHLKARELCPLYPEWDSFQEVRKRTDPEGIFLSPYMRELLGGE